METMVILNAVLAPTGASPDLLEALAGVLQDNPLVTLVGWSLAVFGAGFAARRYFQDRALDRIKSQLMETEEELQAVKTELQGLEAAAAEKKGRLDTIADCLGPEEIKSQLTRLLSHWPKDCHDLIVAGVIRQLLETSGSAWLCTPLGSSLIEVEWDSDRGACRVGSKTDSSVDPIKEVRQFVRDPETLSVVLLELAVYGITSVAMRTSSSEKKVMKVRQGPGLNWQIATETLKRVETDAEPPLAPGG